MKASDCIVYLYLTVKLNVLRLHVSSLDFGFIFKDMLLNSKYKVMKFILYPPKKMSFY